MSNSKILQSRVSEEDPMIKITNREGKEVNIKFIELNSHGNIVGLEDFNEHNWLVEDFIFDKYLLNVPGIGYIPPESRIVYKDQEFVLKFGWHTNISNQEIFSWYLLPCTTDEPCKTLYREMIDQIEEVHFN